MVINRKKKGWIRENIREVRGAFAMHILMNPLQYLCKTLPGARGTAMMVLGLQYMDAESLKKGMAVYMIGALAAALCGAADSVFQAKTECGIRLRQKRELLRAILYRKRGGRELSAELQEILITDVENIVGFFGTQISNFITPVAVSLICIGAVFMKSGIIAFIVLFSMCLAAVINLYFLPKLHAQIREVREVENRLTARYTDTILGSAVIKVFSCQKYYLGEIGRNIRNVMDSQTKEVRIRFLQGLALNLLSFSSMTVPFLAGAVLTVLGRMDLSTMIYITQLSGNLLWFINTFTGTVTEMQRTGISRERIESVLGQGKSGQGAHQAMSAQSGDMQGMQDLNVCKKPENEEMDCAGDREDVDPGKSSCQEDVSERDCAVRLERLNVSLGGRRILKDISLEIPRGACVAFVGESGCGKTTIFKALQDFVPWQGRIALFGKDADSMEEETRYGLMSLVSQDVGLMGGTIYENILIGDRNASRKEVEEAAGWAQVDRFACRLEAGLDTEIGENGSTLSGGERQRVALARGFLKNAPILMLDEVTSALDPETEENIVSAIEKFRGRHTILIIAQKLNTIRNADRIFCIKDGEIAGRGTHEELMENCAEYRRLAMAGADGGIIVKC